ncbi:hypothetical protein BH601_15640 [Pseudomonas aeruginosa]|nr:hypothetical protein BH601_15640 [Pseudomonas aeruginosa]
MDVIEVDALHQLLAGQAGRIHATRSRRRWPSPGRDRTRRLRQLLTGRAGRSRALCLQVAPLAPSRSRSRAALPARRNGSTVPANGSTGAAHP